jgi:hypothetical protein
MAAVRTEEHIVPAAAMLARTGPPLPGLGLDLLGQQVRQERREVDGQAGFQWGLR